MGLEMAPQISLSELLNFAISTVISWSAFLIRSSRLPSA